MAITVGGATISKRNMARILVVDNETECRSLLTEALASAGHTVDQAPDGKKAVSAACVYVYDLVLLDIDLPKRGGIRALQSILDECPETTVIAKTELNGAESAVQALKLGAYDFISEPLQPDVVKLTVERALAHRRLVDQNSHLLEELKGHYRFENVIAANPVAKKAYQMAREIAATDSPVLICGESGTGKEYFARAIHYHSSRAAGPFVKLNCSALSDERLEAEMFGREKGVARENSGRHIGRLELANGGTLFLDDISDIGPEVQDKVLRVLQHREFERVGGSRTFTANVRFIGAATCDLSGPAGRNNRGELQEFLNVFTINLPPLRERTEDIPALVHHFVAKYASETGKTIVGIGDAVMQQLLMCEWKGNIRQLENCVERCVMQCDSDIIQPNHLHINGANGSAKRKQAVMKPLRDIERDHIRRVLVQCNWNKSASANVLQIDRKTLRCKIREFGFEQPNERRK